MKISKDYKEPLPYTSNRANMEDIAEVKSGREKRRERRQMKRKMQNLGMKI